MNEVHSPPLQSAPAPSESWASLSPIAQLYVASVTTIGLLVSALSLHRLYAQPVGYQWLTLAALTLISGSASVKLPSVPASISISETFTFASVLLFGPPAGTLTVALDALVMSFWVYRRGTQVHRVLFNVSASSAAIWIAGTLCLTLQNIQPLSIKPTPIGELVLPLVLFTIVYFLLNSWTVAVAVGLATYESFWLIWRCNFLWVSLNYFGGASIAALLVVYTRNVDLTFLAVIVPLLLVLYLTYKTSMARVEDANRHLSQVNTLYLSTIETLAMAIDAKDQITHGHIRRVQAYAVQLAKTVGIRDTLQLKAIEAAALLHDMGKLAVPEYILNKPGPLTPTEFERMKLHSTVGADILSAIDFPYPVVPIVRHHHESWDGNGYPTGLAGTDIPIGARILAVVDCFDALTSDRPYRPRLADADALNVLIQRRGTMYDPVIVDMFVRVYPEMVAPEAASHVAKDVLNAITSSRSDLPSGTVVAKSRLKDISSSSEEMLALYELSRSLVGRINLSDVGDILFKHLRRLMPTSLCVFYVYDEQHDELYGAHAAGEGAALVRDLRIALGQRLSGWVAANRQTIGNSDPVLDLGEVARTGVRLQSSLSTPLVDSGRLVGVLTLYGPSKEAFSEDHKRIIETVARQIGPTVRQAIEFENSRAVALRDPVTGLPNRRQLSDFVAFHLNSDHAEALLSILLIDIDRLRSVNERYGRAVGDRLLESAVDAIRGGLRSGDLVFRYASDEFIVVLPQTGDGTAAAVANRIGLAISGMSSGAEDKKRTQRIALSLAIGVATAPFDGRSVDELAAKARARLGQPFTRDSVETSEHLLH